MYTWGETKCFMDKQDGQDGPKQRALVIEKVGESFRKPEDEGSRSRETSRGNERGREGRRDEDGGVGKKRRGASPALFSPPQMMRRLPSALHTAVRLFPSQSQSAQSTNPFRAKPSHGVRLLPQK